MFRTIALAVALLGATAASPVFAAEYVQKVQGRVSYAGLDLGDPSDTAELQDRIDRKAKKICTRGLHQDLWDGPEVKACKASVVASGRAELAKLFDAQSLDNRVALSD